MYLRVEIKYIRRAVQLHGQPAFTCLLVTQPALHWVGLQFFFVIFHVHTLPRVFLLSMQSPKIICNICWLNNSFNLLPSFIKESEKPFITKVFSTFKHI